MLRYILKRILIFIPTLLVISVLTFMLNAFAPGDPIEIFMTNSESASEGERGRKNMNKEYIRIRKDLNLDLPIFYASLSTQAYPDTLYRVVKKRDKENLNRLIGEYGNWQEIEAYFKKIKDLDKAAWSIPSNSDNKKVITKIRQFTDELTFKYDDSEILKIFKNLEEKITEDSLATAIMTDKIATTQKAYQTVKETKTPWKHYIPAIHFYGFNNQYHKWVSGFVQLDFGKSYQTRRPIKDMIGERIFWTILISFISIILSYLIAVPLGVFSALKKGTKADGAVTTGLFLLYSLPNFWVATLLIFFLAQPQWLDLFPPYGIGNVSSRMSGWEIFSERFYHLVLPVFCWTYPTLAFLSRQMRGGMLGVMRQDYIRTARAKGLSNNVVVWKHAFRNSLTPIITLFANVFPRLIAGSVVLEVIFTIPGMGKTIFDAIIFKDYPMIITVVMMAAILTMVGYLVADILYAVVDPRVKFSKK